MNEFYLIDYKGKFTIIVDELDDFDYEVGRILKEQAIEEAEERKVSAEYYGVPAYVGNDKELKKLYANT